MTTAKELLDRIAEVANAVAWQAGVGGMEVAGQIVSGLYANPEHIERFMVEGPELIIDGTLAPDKGCLSYTAINGSIMTPAELRKRNGGQQ